MSTGGAPLALSVVLTVGIYYVSQTNSYGYESERTAITVSLISSVPAQPSTITGTSPVCRNTSDLIYSVTNVPGVTFTWTVPAGWSITASQNTNSITVTAGTAGGPVRNRNVTVNNVPGQPSVITGNITVCSGATGLTYSVTNVSNVSYNWTVPEGWTITNGNGSNSITVTAGTTNGNITVTPSNTCGSGAVRNLAVASNSCSPPAGQGNTSWSSNKYVGAFWKDSQKGERIIAGKSAGNWSAEVFEPTGSGSWLTLALGIKDNATLYTATPDDAEGYPLAAGIKNISGTGDILFCIGATSTNPNPLNANYKYPDGSNGRAPRYVKVIVRVASPASVDTLFLTLTMRHPTDFSRNFGRKVGQ